MIWDDIAADGAKWIDVSLGGITLTKMESYLAPRVFLIDNDYEASN